MRYDHLGSHTFPEDIGNETANALNRAWRVTVLMLLGGKCSRCGSNDSRALQVDHVHGDGKHERRGARWQRSIARLTDVFARALRGELQVLCANCNWIKRSERGEHGR